MRMFLALLALCLPAACATANTPLGQTVGASNSEDAAAHRKFYAGYAGSLPQDERLLARTYFDNPQIRALIYDLEAGPVRRDRVEDALRGTDFAVDDLLRVKILRRDGDRYVIGFNYFTLADMAAIHTAADKYVPELVNRYLENQEAFDEIFSHYPPASVSKDYIAFALIAGFSLNWDALKLSQEEGYRKPELVTGSEEGRNWKYSFWASEADEDYDIKGFIWGSSTFPFGPGDLEKDPVDYTFSSYGDPDSDPRMNFPDLFLLGADDLAPEVYQRVNEIGFRDEDFFGQRMENILGVERMRSIGPILFALRERPMTEKELVQFETESDKGSIDAIMALLVEIQYVTRRSDGYFELHAPAFDVQDQKMIDEALALSRRILQGWFEDNYASIRADLGELTSMKHSVAFESLFTQIWHEFFGLTTQQLADAGFIADVYSADVRYPGSLGVLWRSSLYDLDLK